MFKLLAAPGMHKEGGALDDAAVLAQPHAVPRRDAPVGAAALALGEVAVAARREAHKQGAAQRALVCAHGRPGRQRGLGPIWSEECGEQATIVAPVRIRIG